MTATLPNTAHTSLLRDEDQHQLQLSVRKAIATHAPLHRVRDFVDHGEEGALAELEQILFTQMGLGGLGIPDQRGGSGEGTGEIAAVLEELGRGLAPSHFLSTTAICGQALQKFDASGSVTQVLQDIAAGTVTVAYAPLSGRTDQVVSSAGLLTGVVTHAADATHADMVLVEASAGQGRTEFHLVPTQSTGVRVRPLISSDPTRVVGMIELNSVESVELPTRDSDMVKRDIDALAAFAVAAEQLGGLLAAVESTVEYSRIRVQFGRSIGSYQAIKHRLADMRVISELATALVRAAVSVENSPAEFSTSAHAAHAYLSRSFMHVSREMIQLHGGVGFTWEHAAHLYFKRANASSQLIGGPARHEEIVADRLGLSNHTGGNR